MEKHGKAEWKSLKVAKTLSSNRISVEDINKIKEFRQKHKCAIDDMIKLIQSEVEAASSLDKENHSAVYSFFAVIGNYVKAWFYRAVSHVGFEENRNANKAKAIACEGRALLILDSGFSGVNKIRSEEAQLQIKEVAERLNEIPSCLNSAQAQPVSKATRVVK